MNQPIAEIFSQGEEVICGQVADTNAAWLSEELVQLGFSMSRHTAVGDKLDDLVDLLQEISHRAELCICTGGLGPTVDDLTTEAVAKAFDCPLSLNQPALDQIEAYFSRRNRVMEDSNRKQAYFPQSARCLDNALGSAPGFMLKQNQCLFVFLPGVPSEMRHIFNALVKDDLRNQFTLQTNRLVAIKSIGVGESELQQRLDHYSFPSYVQLGFRATTGEVQTKLSFSIGTAESDIAECVSQVAEIIGDHVYGIDDVNQAPTDFISVISQLMQDKNYTLTVIESITQGLISAKCIGHDWLQSSRYIRSTTDFLTSFNMPEQGSPENNAQAIANKLKLENSSDIILVQLYHGSKEQCHHHKESITLYNVLLTPQGMHQSTATVTGSINRKQNQAAIKALDLLRRVLQNKCL